MNPAVRILIEVGDYPSTGPEDTSLFVTKTLARGLIASGVGGPQDAETNVVDVCLKAYREACREAGYTLLERELNDVRLHQAYDTRLLEALGRHVAFQVHEPGFPAFAMIDPETRRSMSTPLRVELEFFLRECCGERFEDGR